MDDHKIIELFFARSEQAIAELSNKYGAICHQLSVNIVKNPSDAEECVNDAYLGAWNTIPPQNPDPLLTYICRIVRNLSVKRYHRNTAKKRNSYYDVALDEIEGCFSDAVTEREAMETDALAALLDEFLDGLSCEERVLFVRRYWFSDSIESLAARFGITKHNVSVRLSRTREKLKDYLAEKGVRV